MEKKTGRKIKATHFYFSDQDRPPPEAGARLRRGEEGQGRRPRPQGGGEAMQVGRAEAVRHVRRLQVIWKKNGKYYV